MPAVGDAINYTTAPDTFRRIMQMARRAKIPTMPITLRTNEPLDPARLETEVKPLARELERSLRALLQAIPGGPHKPTSLARRVGMNRVLASKLLNAIARDDPFEVLQHIPGPESLRVVTDAAARMGVAEPQVDRANQAIEQFARLIREQFGTRSALNAAISPQTAGLQQHFEHASRYQVFEGMRRILGVEADTWLTCMMFTPVASDEEALAVTTIHGALGMRRLRPDVDVHFTFGAPNQELGDSRDLSSSPIVLDEFCTHKPATLDSRITRGQLVHRLVDDALGRQAVLDMLAVSHNARGSRRYATPERPRGGAALFVDVPVKMLIFDALVHDEVFPGAAPELRVYNPGPRGPANPNDPFRDIDRIDVLERAVDLGKSDARFALTEVPHYADMIDRVCAELGFQASRFRVCRVRMPYPVHAFQFVMAFAAPTKPA